MQKKKRDIRKMEGNNIQPVVSIKNLKKYFSNVKAVDGISFKIYPGEVYGLLGPNGAGKTTTIKNILGILEPDEGEISVLGLNPLDEEIKVKQHIGYVAEEQLIYKSLSPKELYEFIISVRGLDPEKTIKRVEELTESLGTTEYFTKPILTLSKGNKQKVQIICALLHEPKFLIMDEPLAGLDARSGRIVKDIIKIFTDNGGAVLFSTHIMEIAEDICDRIGILNKGKMITEGTLDELKSAAKSVSGEDLEEIFLRLTQQDESIHEIVNKLKKSFNGGIN